MKVKFYKFYPFGSHPIRFFLTLFLITFLVTHFRFRPDHTANYNYIIAVSLVYFYLIYQYIKISRVFLNAVEVEAKIIKIESNRKAGFLHSTSAKLFRFEFADKNNVIRHCYSYIIFYPKDKIDELKEGDSIKLYCNSRFPNTVILETSSRYVFPNILDK